MHFGRYISLAASVATAAAQYKGFNYGSTNSDGSAKVLDTFQNEFRTAANLVGGSGFTSARLYTMVQAGTTNSPIQAIQAAINTKTSLLLGLWASAGQDSFNNELAALTAAIGTYGSAFSDLVVGISVGSEDLYRITPTGIANNAGVGASPDTLVTYIKEVRNVIANTVLAGKPIGHVDTWTAYVNGSNNALISACDFLGVDAYPYFETTTANSIENGNARFFAAYDQTVAVAQGKPVWVTETGWPVSGPQAGQAVASVANSKAYWDSVGCALFGKTNVFWYTLFDAPSSPSFGIVGNTLSTTPLFDLTCPAASSSSVASSAAATSTQQQNQATGNTLSTVVTPTISNTAVASSNAAGNTAGNSAPTTVTLSTTTAGNTTPSTAGAAPTTTSGNSTPATQQTGTTRVSSAPVATATTSGGSAAKVCPAALTGTWEFPHLIIPVDKNQPSTAFGTSYSGTFNDHVSTTFNFDLPASYAGMTCSLVFLFPTQDQLTTSSFTFSGAGGLNIYELSSPVSQSTTYSTVPSGIKLASVTDVKPGNSYVVASHECAAGKTVSFEFEATDSLALDYFQNYGQSPIGAYITVC